MSTTMAPLRHGRADARVQALHQLKVALAVSLPERKHDWTEGVESALNLLEKALKEARTGANAPDSVLAEVDETRETLARQADGIRQERVDLLSECLALQLELQTAAHAVSIDNLMPGSQSADAAPTTDNDVWQTLRQRLEDFRARVEGILQAETELVQESITTDIGAGD